MIQKSTGLYITANMGLYITANLKLRQKSTKLCREITTDKMDLLNSTNEFYSHLTSSQNMESKVLNALTPFE